MSEPIPRREKPPKFPHFWTRAVITVVGLASLLSVVYVLMQLARFSPWVLLQPNLPATYLAAVVFPFGVGICFLLLFPFWLIKRRSVYPAEIAALVAEVGRYGDSSTNQQAVEHAREQRDKLESLDSPLELDVLALRHALADLYHPKQELISKVRRELELLEEYAFVGEHDLDKERSKRVNSAINDLIALEVGETADEENNGRGDQLLLTLRAELKTLRDSVTWYENTWAFGEVLRQGVTWSMLAALFSTFVIGILPLVHSQGDLNISLLHWTALGAFGAMLALVLELQQLDLPELGETQGKQLLQGSVRSLAIGAGTAALLYFALWGEALGGKAFPNLPTHPGTGEHIDLALFQNVGLSAFWAILAGLSPVVLRRLTRIADTTLGETRREGEGE